MLNGNVRLIIHPPCVSKKTPTRNPWPRFHNCHTEGRDRAKRFFKSVSGTETKVFLMGVEPYRATYGAASGSIQGSGPSLISLHSQVSGKLQYYCPHWRCI
jgi:hypothetical protein